LRGSSTCWRDHPSTVEIQEEPTPITATFDDHRSRHSLIAHKLDWFAAWLWTDGRRKYLPELEFVDGPQHVDRQWLCSVEDQIQRSGAPSPYGGGTDPLHLTGHIDGPMRDVPQGAVFTPGIAGGTAILAARSMEGWYRELLHRSDLHALDSDSSGVEVIVEPVGSLGVFRRSPVTALWFSCGHGVHLVGN
jgi:hypothetical protein